MVIGNSLKDVIPLWSAIFCLGIQPRDVVLSTFCMQSSLNSLKNTTIVSSNYNYKDFSHWLKSNFNRCVIAVLITHLCIFEGIIRARNGGNLFTECSSYDFFLLPQPHPHQKPSSAPAITFLKIIHRNTAMNSYNENNFRQRITETLG